MSEYEGFRVNDDDYIVEELPLGGHIFGLIYKCHKKSTGETFVKRVLGGPFTATHAEEKYYFGELSAFVRIPVHPAIAGFEGFSNSKNQRSIYTEYIPNGSLSNLLKTPNVLTPTIRSKIAFGVSTALLHLHSHNTYHRYLSPRKIMFDEMFNPIIVDFGFARLQKDDAFMSAILANPIYVPPEVSSGEKETQDQVDAFAFMTIMYELMSGEELFNGITPRKAYQNMVERNYPNIPQDFPVLSELLESTWHKDYDNRPRIVEIVEKLKDSPEAPFPGTDMKEYNDYKYYVLEKTDLNEEALYYMSSLKNISDSLNELEKVEDEDDEVRSDTLLKIGLRYLEGDGTEIDIDEAISYFQQSVELGNQNAKYRLARTYNILNRSSHEIAEAKILMKEAADQGVIRAYYHHANNLMEEAKNEEGDAKNAKIEEAMNFYKIGASKGVGECFYQMGLYEYSQGNIRNALLYYSKASKNQIAEAEIERGMIYLKGDQFIEPNTDSAIQHFKKAHFYGSGVAAYNLARLYSEKVKSNCTMNNKTEDKAEDKTKDEAEDMSDENTAVYYYKEAIRLENVTAMCEFANVLLNGQLGQEENTEEAAYLVHRAAKNGFPSACYMYAHFCENGIGRTVDLGKALKYSRKALELKYERALLQYPRLQYKMKECLTNDVIVNAIQLLNRFLKTNIAKANEESRNKANQLLNDLKAFKGSATNK
ncbi:hypothetical protein TRFO_18497 [Tritrichomonas foetus]|uniref:Protein kinase domain-containing protein n=1 Tax=Tritrichomonas foetus TaxID=1144522 RepID=A0A1J4KKU2_9EUKA|nr:hypothetical protein TRFO_18497 [Tritrichomonas foetus]|eukprot:OHT11911.1 hypothetical protein TRFO_18497 [Tritrichomonas foetus]